uniref:Uncharacterized protein n=1 Tax=Glossina pallidipes TaxID=7398 RepID=A0A1B0AG21_GLOPL
MRQSRSDYSPVIISMNSVIEKRKNKKAKNIELICFFVPSKSTVPEPSESISSIIISSSCSVN